MVKDVCERRFASIHADLVRAIEASADGPAQIGELLESVFKTLEGDGHGRVVFWLALEGVLHERDELRLRDVGRAAHELRTRRRGGDAAPLEDTLHIVALGAFALLAESVVGKAILRDAGLGDDDAAGVRFRRWLGALIADQLVRGPAPAE